VFMEVNTTTSGFSQMFFAAEENGFSEQQSRSALINPQTTQLEFPFGLLRGTVGNFQRWDPSNAPGDFLVSGIRLKGLIANEEVPLTSLLPSLDMSAIEIGPDGASFRAESNDPQTLLQMDLQRFYWTNMWQTAIAAGGNQNVDISVNGIPVGTIPASGGGEASEHRFEITPEVLNAPGNGRVVVGFTTPESVDTPRSGVNRDMASGGLSLTSVTLTP